MEENMNTELEVTTNMSEMEDVDQNDTFDDSTSGPSGGFVALAVGVVGALAVGAGLLARRHKKKKAAAKKEEEDQKVDDDSEVFEEDVVERTEIETVEVEKVKVK